MPEIPNKIPIDALPIEIQKIVSPDSPIEQRERVAKAAIPMGALELLECLVYLMEDKSESVKKIAKKTISELPLELIKTAISLEKNPLFLAIYAILFFNTPELVYEILENPFTSDETFEFFAKRAKGEILERIADNQIRYLRYPKIIEALYYNLETKMITINKVLETAVRNQIDLSHIPGYEEIVESIFGKEAKIEKEKISEPAIPFLAGEEGIEEDTFHMILLSASLDTAGEIKIEEDSTKRKDFLAELSKMATPQKVRLALLGNEFIRSVLIHDTRRIIYMSVLKSPRLLEKEIISFARDKSLPDEVIKTIANNREWTKNYTLRHALVTNPKTPPTLAFHFLRTLTKKDIKMLSYDKDVPGYITKQAKELSEYFEKKKL